MKKIRAYFSENRTLRDEPGLPGMTGGAGENILNGTEGGLTAAGRKLFEFTAPEPRKLKLRQQQRKPSAAPAPSAPERKLSGARNISGKPVGLGMAPGKKRKGDLFSLAGKRAKTADFGALAQARQMSADGKSQNNIWQKTGWILGADDQWRFEIPDIQYKAGPKGDADFPFKNEPFPVAQRGGLGADCVQRAIG